MMLARKFLRPVVAVLLSMVLLVALGAWALAEDNDPVDFTIQVSPASLTAPGEVNVSLRVSNPSNTDMIDPVTLYDPAGNVVASFGDGGSYILKSGDSVSWEGVWNVSQDELDAGGFSYTLKYHVEDADGTLVELNRQAAARLEFAGERVKLSITRTISPEVVRSGNKATVVYELYNSGNVELVDIRVKENISKNAQTVKSLPAGERTTLEFSTRIGNADLTSSAAITYQAKGTTKTLTDNVEEAVIPLARPNLKIELSSPTAGVNIGEPATLVIMLINSGNVAYSNVTVSEAKKGEILTNLSIPAGATVVEEKEFILTEPTTFKLTASLPDNTGETRTLSSNELTLGVYDPEKTMLLTLNLTSDQEAVRETPADVRFHLTVTNNSNVKAEKIAITHGSVPIDTIDALEPGESMTITRDVRISQAGKFRFAASVKDTMNNQVSFESNTIQIAYAQITPAPTAKPIVTAAPPVLVTPVPADPILTQGRSALMTAAVIIGALFVCALVLFLVSSVIRLKNKSKSNAAYDHLDLSERRDYTEPADDEFDEDEEPAVETTYTEQDEEVGELPHEKLVKDAEEEAASDAEEEAPQQEDLGGYRISRHAQEEEKPEEAAAEEPAAIAEKTENSKENAPRHRRRSRSQRTEDGE